MSTIIGKKKEKIKSESVKETRKCGPSRRILCSRGEGCERVLCIGRTVIDYYDREY